VLGRSIKVGGAGTVSWPFEGGGKGMGLFCACRVGGISQQKSSLPQGLKEPTFSRQNCPHGFLCSGGKRIVLGVPPANPLKKKTVDGARQNKGQNRDPRSGPAQHKCGVSREPLIVGRADQVGVRVVLRRQRSMCFRGPTNHGPQNRTRHRPEKASVLLLSGRKKGMIGTVRTPQKPGPPCDRKGRGTAGPRTGEGF